MFILSILFIVYNIIGSLKTILNKIILNEDFNSEYITFEEKNYFLKNFEKISFHIGNFNEFAVIKKK